MLRRVTIALRHFGLGWGLYSTALLILLRLTGFGIWRCIVLDVQNRTADAADDSPELALQFDCRALSYEELVEFGRDPTMELDQPTLQLAERKRDVCVGVIDHPDGCTPRLVSYGWYSTKPTAIDGHQLVSVSKNYVYKYKSFTLHEYRGQRLHAVGTRLAAERYRLQGLLGIISFIEEHNLASIRSFYRSGFRPFGLVLHFRGTPFWFSKGCRVYGFEIYPETAITRPAGAAG